MKNWKFKKYFPYYCAIIGTAFIATVISMQSAKPSNVDPEDLIQTYFEEDIAKSQEEPQTPPSHDQNVSIYSYFQETPAPKKIEVKQEVCEACAPQGWSLGVGGGYTWMSLTTPPTSRGNTGSVSGSIQYEKDGSLFSSLRTVYNIGKFSSKTASASDNELYTEFVSGYSLCFLSEWTFTPYMGVGLDFYNDNRKKYVSFYPINLKYRSYYAIFGMSAKRSWEDWYVGLQADCLPVFHQYLSIGGISGSSWKLNQRVGLDVRLPFGRKVQEHIWAEIAPYYRLLPFGKSTALSLQERTLNQWGVYATIRFFL